MKLNPYQLIASAALHKIVDWVSSSFQKTPGLDPQLTGGTAVSDFTRAIALAGVTSIYYDLDSPLQRDMYKSSLSSLLTTRVIATENPDFFSLTNAHLYQLYQGKGLPLKPSFRTQKIKDLMRLAVSSVEAQERLIDVGRNLGLKKTLTKQLLTSVITQQGSPESGEATISAADWIQSLISWLHTYDIPATNYNLGTHNFFIPPGPKLTAPSSRVIFMRSNRTITKQLVDHANAKFTEINYPKFYVTKKPLEGARTTSLTNPNDDE